MYIFGIGLALAVANYAVDLVSPSLQHSADMIRQVVTP